MSSTVAPATRITEPAGSHVVRDPDGKRLVDECIAGDRAARARFQEQFGPLIYRFVGTQGQSLVEPGDFYLYAFDDDRLYRRIRSYEGRVSLTAFLRGFALPALLAQYRAVAKKRSVDTTPLNTETTAEDTLASAQPGAPSSSTGSPGANLLAALSPEKRLLVKLLYIEDFTLDPAEIQALARRSGRAVRTVAELIERARESVRAREAARRARLDEAESAAQWIQQYERQLAEVKSDLADVPPRSTRARRLRETQAELERKQVWRREQRMRAMQASDRAILTLRYREIAEILNVPVGSVSSQVTRLRQELVALAAEDAAQHEASQ